MEFLPNKQLAFYQPDLEIVYIECENSSFPPNFTVSKKQYHQIFYLISGKFKFITENNKFYAEKGTMVISKHNHSFRYRRMSERAKFLTIYFHDNIFKSIGQGDFLRAFNNLPSGAQFYPASFENLVCYEIVNSFVNNLQERRNRFYMLIKLQALIAELGFKYDVDCNNEKHDKSNVTLNVIEFVKNNYTRDITLKTIQDKFFICNSTINRMFKQATGMTFKKFLNQLRLNNANSLLKSNNYISTSKIAEMCGFKTYSSFYREYIKKFGVAPTKTTPKSSKETWPLK